MHELTKYESLVLELFGLDTYDVESISYSNIKGEAYVDVRLVSHPIPCPECGNEEFITVHGYVKKCITHSVLTDRRCILRYHARRYICPLCSRTYYENNPFVFKAMKISTLTVMNILNDLKDFNETFSSVAKRYHISPTTAAKIFDEHISIPRKTLPKLLNFDEVYAFHYESSKYVCMLLDYTTQTPIDLLPSRRIDYLNKYFASIPLEEREKVEACCFDMYTAYRSVTRKWLPNAITIVDVFHVRMELSRKIDSIRIKVMKRYDKDSDEYYLLKKFNWMIFKNEDDKAKNGKTLFDPNVEGQLNRRFKRYLNYYQIREMIWNIDYELKTAWKLKDEVVSFYQESNIDNASVNLTELIQKFRDSGLSEMIDFGQTLSRWRTEIINSFTIFNTYFQVNIEDGSLDEINQKMNNGIIENKNAIIKCIKKNANGYTNWERFRNRVMYVLDPDIHYSLNPIKKPKKK